MLALPNQSRTPIIPVIKIIIAIRICFEMDYGHIAHGTIEIPKICFCSNDIINI